MNEMNEEEMLTFGAFPLEAATIYYFIPSGALKGGSKGGSPSFVKVMRILGGGLATPVSNICKAGKVLDYTFAKRV